MPFSSPALFSEFSSSSSTPLVVSREEFNAFHKIDRTLFTRFVFVLKRDINQSYHVMAFLFLLEQKGYARNVIAYLAALPDTFIDAVANEIGLCLSFLYNQNLFVGTVMDDEFFIPLVLRLTGGNFTLGLIDQNRETFLQTVASKLESVCSRAFEDLRMRAERHRMESLQALERERVIEEMRNMTLSAPQVITPASSIAPQETSATHLPLPPPPPPPAKEITNKPAPRTEVGNKPAPRTEVANKPYPRTEVTNKPYIWVEVTKKPSASTEPAVEEEGEAKVVAADDRTVFLTFSKGYPISEEEIRVHFTKLFGDVIEAIVMQEVEEKEQPLYARMVLKMQYASKMGEMVSGRNRVKYTINGKHVWARKYIPKNPNSASSSHF